MTFNRRQFINLAALSSMGLSLNAASNKKVLSNKNLVIYMNGGGFNEELFSMKGENPDSSFLLSQCKDIYNDITILKDINQRRMPGGHKNHDKVLSCNAPFYPGGSLVSIDEFIADKLQQQTRYRMLNCGSGSTGIGGQPVISVPGDPKALYEYLFLKQGHQKEFERKLDYLSRYSKSNKEYSLALKNYRKDIETSYEWAKKDIPEVEFNTTLNLEDGHNRGLILPIDQRFELINLALKHKRAQVINTGIPYIDSTSQLALPSSYHSVGHQALGCDESHPSFQAMQRIESYVVKSFVTFVQNLKNDNLLDDTIVLMIGTFSEPGSHRRKYIPAVIAGGGLNHQGVINCKEKNGTYKHSLANLFVTIMHQMGLDYDSFAQDKGDMDSVLL